MLILCVKCSVQLLDYLIFAFQVWVTQFDEKAKQREDS